VTDWLARLWLVALGFLSAVLAGWLAVLLYGLLARQLTLAIVCLASAALNGVALAWAWQEWRHTR